jgi:phosphatidylserine decarboxylase
MAPLLQLLSILPQNLISQLTGWVTRWKLPRFIQVRLNNWFVGVFGIDMSESAKTTDEFLCLEDLFVRALKPNSRQVSSSSLVSPSDGKWVLCGPIQQGQAIQAKGLSYSAIELITGSIASAPTFELGMFSTVYLAPHNYHRVHSPVDGVLDQILYIPGRLWPVNESAVRGVPELFCRNERLVFRINLASNNQPGTGMVWLVMVGAFNVGRMTSPFLDNFCTNDFRVSENRPKIILEKEITLARGQEIGTFMLGSTVVMVFDRLAADQLKPKTNGVVQSVLMGQSML